jgi:glutamyl-tRNA synthetase
MNGHYMRACADAELLASLIASLPYLPNGGSLIDKIDAPMQAKLLAAMPGLKERAKTLVELLEGAMFLFAERPLKLDDKAAGLLDAAGRSHVAQLLPRLTALPQWTAAAAEAAVRSYAEENRLKLGQVAQPLRAALTGRATSPGIFDVLEVLGRQESLGRLEDQSR